MGSPVLRIKYGYIVLLALVVIFAFSLAFKMNWDQRSRALGDAQLELASNELREVYSTISKLSLEASTCSRGIECRDKMNLYLASEFPQVLDRTRLLVLSSEDVSFASFDTVIQELRETSVSAAMSNSSEQWFTMLGQLRNAEAILTQAQHVGSVAIRGKMDDYAVIFAVLLIAALALSLLSFYSVRAALKRWAGDHHSQWQQVEKIVETLGRQRTLVNFDARSNWEPATKELVDQFKQREAMMTEAKRSVELFKNINKSINYEFRSLTNTVSGGLRLMSGEVDGKYLVLAKEMMQATAVLEELSDNFYGVLAADSTDERCEVSDVITRLIAMLAAKTERHHKSLDCFVGRSVPHQLAVSAVKLIWAVYLDMTKAIDLYRNKQIVVMINAKKNTETEQQVSFDFHFVSDTSGSVLELQNRDWGVETEVSYLLSDLIFDGSVAAEMTYSYCPEGDVRYQLVLGFDAIRPVTVKPVLQERRLVLLGQNNLASDIAVQQLKAAGAEVELVTTIEALGSKLREERAIDAIVTTDVPEELSMDNALRVVRELISAASSQASLILSTPVNQLDLASSDLVDGIIQRPVSQYTLVNQINSLVTATEHDAGKKELNIVCIDDDPIHGLLLTELLQEGGWKAIHFEDPGKGIDYVTSEPVDVVFMDCIMPEIDGFEATRRLRAYQRSMPNRSKLTIIGATGLTSVAEMNECIEAGMDYVINKPYTQADIYKVLKTHHSTSKLVSQD